MIKLPNPINALRKHPLFCAHEFKGKDMKLRNDKGIVKWACCKCGKDFEAESGLEVLKHGKCIGEWRS